MIDLVNWVEINANGIIDEFINEETSEDLSLYSGYSGAIFFLIELYKNNYDELTLTKLDSLIDKSYVIWRNKKESSSNYSLYVGFCGLAFSLLDAYEVIRNDDYLIKAKEILKDCIKHPNEDYKCEMLHGVSGIIICLIKARNYINEEWLDNYINKFTFKLVSKTKFFNDKGLFWDVSHLYKYALSGFSHGNSGISFVFQHLFQLSQKTIFKEISDAALKYEDNFFSNITNNWEDLRHFYKDEVERIEFLDQFKIIGIDFFNKKKFFNAWCHGTPGIIVNRFYTQFQVDKLDEVCIKFKESLLDKRQNHSLCHGSLGNLLCLMQISDNQKIEDYIFPLLNNAIDFFNLKGKFEIINYDKNKNSLFLGDLGCFYVILKINEFIKKGNISSSVLFPIINTSNNLVLEIDDKNIYNSLLSNSFPNTLAYLNTNQLKIDFDRSLVNLKKNFESAIKQLNIEELNAIIDFELALDNVLLPKTGYNFNVLKTELDDFILKKSTNEDIKNLKVELNENVILHKESSKTQIILFSNFPVEYSLQSNFILEFLIHQLKTYSSLSIKNIINKLKEKIDFNDSEEYKIIDVIIISIKKGLLRLNLK